jgi:signal transduction histidine kinase
MKGIVNIAEQDGGTMSDMQMYIGMIKKNITRLDDFTYNTIQYYKNARNDISISLVDFYAMATDIIDELKYQQEARDMDFQVNCENGRNLYTDKDKLRIILNNMVSNAIKYRRDDTDASFVKLDMRIEVNTIIITVEDNGEGIAENMQGRLFEMFSRFSQRSNGSGLGLYIVKEMIEKLNGTITVQSAAGQGTSFEIRLPVMVNG